MQDDEIVDGNVSSEVSDVDEIDVAENESVATSDDSNKSKKEDSSEAGGDDPSDDELAAFDAKLAQALGTRPGQDDLGADDDSSSDEDMNDEEMEAVDKHLEKVFRERKKLTSKRTEKKEAKETVVNFKCRVLELLEIYVKQQSANALGLSLLLPILTTIRTTRSPQVSRLACDLVREYYKVCKGHDLPQAEDADATFDLLQQIHTEAGKESSNAHASACSQASLLLVRVIVAQDRESLRRVIRAYADTQEKTLFISNYKVKTAFFTDWLNWCSTAKQWLSKSN